MAMQHKLTYGLRRSPTRAALQKMPVTLHAVNDTPLKQGLTVKLVDELRAVEHFQQCKGESGGGMRSKHDIPVLVPVHQSRKDIVRVGASADEEEDDQEKRLKVEERRL